TGLVVQKYSYNAHGKPYVSIGNGLYALSAYTGTLYGNTRLYTGREFENDTGYYYNRARYLSPELGRFISRDPIGQNDQVNLYTYVANSPLKYTDRFGREKQLLEDIKNGNKFTVSLVARNLNTYIIGMGGTHTFIMIDSKDSKGITRTYTIGGQKVNRKLTGIFNHPDDKIEWKGWGGLAPASIKSSIQFDTPSTLTDGEFVQNIYDEYKDYNENHKVKFNIFSKSSLWDSGNCSNLASTILTRASGNDQDLKNQLENSNNLGFDWGIGESLY
ncbi:hypothetical protein HOO68_00030, partial [Candidatus Gracilibacteria bacterium]|nr:hypothetical protein [Candidatus Gracilibacteria bacterium]